MKFISILLLVFFIFTFGAYGQEKANEPVEKASEKVETADDAKTAVCSGCNMEMDKAKMVSAEIDGKMHYFCSEKCKEAYLAKKDKKKEGCEKEKKEIKKQEKEIKKEEKEIKKEECKEKKKEKKEKKEE